jgi:methionyl-tRNA formyltransferase
MNVLFLAKHKAFAEEAAEMVKASASADIIFGQRGDPFPDDVKGRRYDYVISYISPWIVPPDILEQTRMAAINFHPGSAEYPGIGCTNFALYEGKKEYGVTVHHMAPQVDTGKIILEKMFPIFEHDTVYSLTQRCYAYIYTSFVEIWHVILAGKSLPVHDRQWQRKPYRRNELEDLCKLDEKMNAEEIQKRVRATTYPGMPGAYFIRNGERVPAETAL